MLSSAPQRRYGRLEPWKWAVILAAAAAFGCKILLALKTYGTNDVYSLEQLLEIWRYLGTDLFRIYPGANNPPSMLYLLACEQALAHLTGLPFSFWFHVPSILADAGSLWLVWRLLESRLGEPSVRWALIMTALAPASILISGFHGQNDSLMMFFLLLAVYLVEKQRTLAAGAAFGLSLCVKVAPIIAIPALLFYQDGETGPGHNRKGALNRFLHRKWLTFFAATGAVVLAVWFPFVMADPRALLRDLLGYKSGLGHWGISYLTYQLSLYSPIGLRLCVVVEKFGSLLLLGAIGLLSWHFNRGGRKPPLYAQMSLVSFLFLAGTSGFGVQYLAWLVPFAAGLGAGPAALYFATSGVFLFLVYDYWSQGLPWFLADSVRTGDYYFAGLDYFQILCWLSVVVLAWLSWKAVNESPSRLPPTIRLSASVRRPAVALATAVFLIVPAVGWLRGPHARWSVRLPRGIPALQAARQRCLNEFAADLRRLGRSKDSDEVAGRAAQLTAPSMR